MGKLYVVGTPIGNLGDFSSRGIETLQMVDFIAAEDTRVTKKLLSRFAISKPMISYYEHNIRQRGEVIIEKIQSGQNGAIVTDAGMPCISDPGEDLVRLCEERGVEVVAVPGPSAVITALALSGLDTTRFCFEGFLTTNKSGRKAHLKEVSTFQRTLVFYEAPHKLKNTLGDMLEAFGNRKMAICRELTKIHEEVLRMSLEQAVAYYEEVAPKGEFVLVIEGAAAPEERVYSLEEAVEMGRALVEEGLSQSMAAKQIAVKTGIRKNEIYRELCE